MNELFDYEVKINLRQIKIHPRENIIGVVKIKVFTALFLSHAYIEISGKAKCAWSENTFFGHTDYSGEQEFFYCRHTLAGNDGTEVIMDKDNYFYNFKCKLPGHLPATWSGELGYIKYTAQVVIASEKEIIGKHSREIEISPHRNLRFESHLFIEARKDIKRRFRFGFISLGEVTVSLWLPVCGIAAGQSLPVICTIDNNSSVLFGGIVFVLTKIEVYRSNTPKYAIKTVRTDICRIPRMTEILRGHVEYYCVLKADKDVFPTTQYWRCSSWVPNNLVSACSEWKKPSDSGSIPPKHAYGYPNIDMPGVPIIIGTEPLCDWDISLVNNETMKTLLDSGKPIVIDPPPPDEVVEEILNTVDDDFDAEMLANLSKQVVKPTSITPSYNEMAPTDDKKMQTINN